MVGFYFLLLLCISVNPKDSCQSYKIEGSINKRIADFEYKFSPLYQIQIFQCMGEIFCEEF